MNENEKSSGKDAKKPRTLKTVSYLSVRWSELPVMLRTTPRVRTAQDVPDKLWTLETAAKMLGLSIPEVFELVLSSELPLIKKGDKYFILKSEVKDYFWGQAIKLLQERKERRAMYLAEKEVFVNEQKKNEHGNNI
jgi:hypothetical protein